LSEGGAKRKVSLMRKRLKGAANPECKAMSPAWRDCVAKVYPIEFPGGNPIQQGERSYPGRSVRHAAFDVSFYHSVKLPAGATGLPSPGDIVRVSRLISRNKTKRSYSGLVNMRHYKVALYGITTHRRALFAHLVQWVCWECDFPN